MKMAERIVHVLEVIEVEHEDGGPALIATSKSDALSEAVLEEDAIGKAGEAVVESHVADAEFSLFAIGDVTGDAHGADDLAAVVAEGDFSGKHPVLATVRPGPKGAGETRSFLRCATRQMVARASLRRMGCLGNARQPSQGTTSMKGFPVNSSPVLKASRQKAALT